MKRVFEYKDEHLGRCFLVISKIREIHKTFSDLVITFDNGDKKVLSVDDPNGTLAALVQALEEL